MSRRAPDRRFAGEMQRLPLGPLQGLAELAELLARDTEDSRRFGRGMALGALVGAAITGSTMWTSRWGMSKDRPHRWWRFR